MKIGIRPFDVAQDRLPATGSSKKVQVRGFAPSFCASAKAQQPSIELRTKSNKQA